MISRGLFHKIASMLMFGTTKIMPIMVLATSPNPISLRQTLLPLTQPSTFHQTNAKPSTHSSVCSLKRFTNPCAQPALPWRVSVGLLLHAMLGSCVTTGLACWLRTGTVYRNMLQPGYPVPLWLTVSPTSSIGMARP